MTNPGDLHSPHLGIALVAAISVLAMLSKMIA